jgi:hypothetical protein
VGMCCFSLRMWLLSVDVVAQLGIWWLSWGRGGSVGMFCLSRGCGGSAGNVMAQSAKRRSYTRPQCSSSEFDPSIPLRGAAMNNDWVLS